MRSPSLMDFNTVCALPILNQACNTNFFWGERLITDLQLPFIFSTKKTLTVKAWRLAFHNCYGALLYHLHLCQQSQRHPWIWREEMECVWCIREGRMKSILKDSYLPKALLLPYSPMAGHVTPYSRQQRRITILPDPHPLSLSFFFGTTWGRRMKGLGRFLVLCRGRRLDYVSKFLKSRLFRTPRCGGLC